MGASALGSWYLGLLAAPRVKAWLERTTGVVLIAFGVRVAVERR